MKQAANPPASSWRTVQLTIAFDGTRYEGWQSQRKECTLQEIFEKILTKIFGTATAIIGSSRTDSGVHARGFSAHLKTASKLSDSKILKAINFYLPRDIVVLKAKTAGPAFHARFDAKFKTYRYSIWNSPIRPLFEAPYCLWYPHPLHVPRMQKAASFLVGKYDFKAFQDKGDPLTSTVRTIKKFTVKKTGNCINIDVEGSGFLRHMIRILVGTLMEVSKGRFSPLQVKEILRGRNRMKAGPTAKACGLTLLKVKY